MERIRLALAALLLALLPLPAHAYSPPVNCASDGAHAEVYNTALNIWSCVAVSGGAGAVSSVSGDGTFYINSLSAGAVVLTLGNAPAKSIWGLSSTTSGTPGYETSPTISGTMTVGALTVTTTGIANASLANSAVTVAGHSIALGASQAIACGDLSNGATGCSTATGTSGATLPLLNGTNTWSGVQNFNSGDHVLKGATSGTLTINAAATAGSNTLTLPAGTTDFSATGGTSQVVKQTSAGGALTVARLACADLSNAVTSCSTDTTSATNITSGTLPTAQLPTNQIIRSITYVIDGGGSAITTGVKGTLNVPMGCTITGATLIADQTGSIVVDIWKKAFAGTLPTIANTITASDLPTLSSAITEQDTTLTGWTTSISANDMLTYNVNSASTVTRVSVILKCNAS